MTAGVTVAKALHVTEMRTALGPVYTALGQTLPSYTNPSLGVGGTIKAVHISQFRTNVVVLE